MRVVVTAVGSGWLVEVSDAAGDEPPVPAVGRDAALGGLGLYLVAQLAAAHGWTAEDGGRKVVWARVDFTGRGRPGADPTSAPASSAPRTVPAGAIVVAPPAERAGRAPVRSPAGAAATGEARRKRFLTAPRRVSVIVAAVVLIIALGLAWLASSVNANNNEKLLDQQVAQVATLLATQVAVIQTQMADTGHVANATDGRTQPFLNFAAATALSPDISMSLWRVTGDQVERLAVHGAEPRLPDGGAGCVLHRPGTDRAARRRRRPAG